MENESETSNGRLFFHHLYLFMKKRRVQRAMTLHHFDEKICRQFRHRLPRRRKVKLVASAARQVARRRPYCAARDAAVNFCRRRS